MFYVCIYVCVGVRVCGGALVQLWCSSVAAVAAVEDPSRLNKRCDAELKHVSETN